MSSEASIAKQIAKPVLLFDRILIPKNRRFYIYTLGRVYNMYSRDFIPLTDVARDGARRNYCSQTN